MELLKCHLEQDILIIHTVAPMQDHCMDLHHCMDRYGTGFQAGHKALCKPTTKRMDEADPAIVGAGSSLPMILKKWHHKQLIKTLGEAVASKVG